MLNFKPFRILALTLFALTSLTSAPIATDTAGRGFTSTANGTFTGQAKKRFHPLIYVYSLHRRLEGLHQTGICQRLIDRAQAEAEQKAMNQMETHITNYAQENGYRIFSGIDLSARPIGFADSGCKQGHRKFVGHWTGEIEVTGHAFLVHKDEIVGIGSDEIFDRNEEDGNAGDSNF